MRAVQARRSREADGEEVDERGGGDCAGACAKTDNSATAKAQRKRALGGRKSVETGGMPLKYDQLECIS